MTKEERIARWLYKNFGRRESTLPKIAFDNLDELNKETWRQLAFELIEEANL